MTSNSNILSMLETANESSISGLFQELWDKGFKQTSQTTEPLKFGDTEGSDFKRLLHKKDKISSNKNYHQNSPDFRPVVYINHETTTQSSKMMQLGTSLYSFLFQHEDRYFNHDRDELSKDIFPVGQAKAL